MFQKYLIPNADMLPEGEARSVKVANQDFLITKQQGQVVAYRNLCPHQKKTLTRPDTSPLDDQGDYIQCGHHGALFSLQDGHCITGPCHGSQLKKATLGIEQGNFYLPLP